MIINDENHPMPKYTNVPLLQYLMVGFRLPDDSRKVVTFVEKPLGMRLSSVLPVTVTYVEEDGHAKGLGVKAGWVLETVQGEDIIEFKMEAARMLIRGRTKTLR